MADEPNKPPEAPEGFWEDFQAYVMKQFAAGNTPPSAPAPDPKSDPTPDPTPTPKKRKSWFSDES